MPAALVLVLLLAAVPASAREKRRLASFQTVSTATSEGVYRLTFDPKKISEESVRAAMKFNPHEPVPAVDVVLGGEKEVRAASRAVVKFSERPYPKSLKAVRKYFLASGKFYVKSLSTRLEYRRTGKIYFLKQEFSGVVPEKDCSLALDRIEKTKNRPEAWRLADTDWHNCVNLVFNKKNEFPKEAWEKFLAAHGIQESLDRPLVDEKYEELAGDD